MNLATGLITTYAGTGVAGATGDGELLATAATLNNPHTLAVDAAGGVYVMASSTHRVRRIHPATGLITTVAGTGTQGFSGDGGPAINAMFNNPTHVAVDASGRLWIADISNNRVRRVDLANVATVAGTGTAGFSGDGGPAISAMLWVPPTWRSMRTDTYSSSTSSISGSAGLMRRQRLSPPSPETARTSTVETDGPPSTGRCLTSTAWRSIPWGSVYIADRSNHRVRRVDPTTGIITTVAGNGTQGSTPDGGAAASAALSLPRRLAVDASGRVDFTDGDVRVPTIDPFTGILTTVAGNGFRRRTAVTVVRR